MKNQQGLPARPSSAALAAVKHARFIAAAPTDSERVLFAELVHLSACIERCKSVQNTISKAADAENLLDSSSAIVRAHVYREVSAELAKALEGF